MAQVKIGPNFFSGAFRDYSDWQWAWVREILQNCQDAPLCNKIAVDFAITPEGNTVISVFNNGLPMTEEILVNKFLALGESGKRFGSGTVGGFGKAKELLVFCHLNWHIETGNLVAAGAGGEYDLIHKEHYLNGTKTTVNMAGDQTDKLTNNFVKYASYANWEGELTVNGIELKTNLAAGRHRKDFDWGSVYTISNTETLKGKTLCRINGIPMFTRWTSHDDDESIIIELNGSDALTANRDGMVWAASHEFDQFLDLTKVNKIAAFKDSKKPDKKVKFPGYQLGARLEFDLDKNIDVTESASATIAYVLDNYKGSGDIAALLKPQFFIRSDMDINIPEKFMPETFNKNSKTLLEKWSNILVETATLAKCYTPFSVGFCFSEDSLALHENSWEDGHIIYINPATNDLKSRWKNADNFDLLATAAHEFCHLEGYSNHDEKYASRLTELMALILKNYKTFANLL